MIQEQHAILQVAVYYNVAIHKVKELSTETKQVQKIDNTLWAITSNQKQYTQAGPANKLRD